MILFNVSTTGQDGVTVLPAHAYAWSITQNEDDPTMYMYVYDHCLLPFFWPPNMHTSSIRDRSETLYWGLGSTDLDTDVSPGIIMSCQNHNSTHRPTLGHHQWEDKNGGTVLGICPGS